MVIKNLSEHTSRIQTVHPFLKLGAVKKMEAFILLVLDIVAFVAILGTLQWMYYSHIYIGEGGMLYLLLLLFVIFMVNSIFDLYSLETSYVFSSSSHWALSPFAATISFLLMTFLIYFLGVDRFVGHYFGRGILMGTMTGFALTSTFYRWFLHKLFNQFRERQCYLVLANDKTFEIIKKENEKSFRRKNFEKISLENFRILGDSSKISSCSGIVVDDEMLKESDVVTELMGLRLNGVHVFSTHDFFETAWLKVPIFYLKDNWFAMERGFVLIHNPISLKIKRFLDIFYSIVLLMFTWPLFPIISLLIKLNSRGSIFYKQIRTGENGKHFILYKFRSMVQEAENGTPQWSQKNDLRITLVGKFLRRLRLDELPQVWNVIRGDMSFIGPRPERPEFNRELESQIPYYNFRHLVRPGITGWAQVLYPYGSSIEDTVEKLQYELYYIKNYSLLLDFDIIIKTIRTVIFGKGR